MAVDPGTHDPQNIGERFFLQLVRLYPRAFRATYANDLLSTFRADRDRTEFSGVLGSVRFWSHTVADVVRTSVTLRRDGVAKGLTKRPRRSNPLAGIGCELRLSVRTLAREPGFTVVALITLGLGIGATTAVFTIVNGVMLTPLAYSEPEQLVRVYERERDNPNARMVAYGNYVDLDDSGVFEDLAIWAYSSHTLTGEDRARRVLSREVSADFARVLGVAPVMGRWINAAEEVGRERVVVLSDALWRSNFASADSVLGRAIQLDGEPFTVVGVMPTGFDFPYNAQAWIPLAPVTDQIGMRNRHRHNMVGRLALDQSLDQTTVRLREVAQRLEQDNPELNAGNYFDAVPLLDDVVGNVNAALKVLFGAVALLLLIACVNIASLVLVRSTVRAKELAVRVALGASRARLVAHVLSEALLLGVGGGVIGLLLASVGVDAVLRLAAGSIPRTETVGLHGPVFVFAFLAALASGVLVGLLPLARLERHGLQDSNVLTGHRVGASRDTVRNRRTLVIAQLTIALILAVGAALLGRSLRQMISVDTGVNAVGVASIALRLPRAGYPDSPAVARGLAGIVARIERIPGVTRAAAMLTPPMSDNGWANNLTIRDRPTPLTERPAIGYNMVTGGYFETLEVPVLAGNVFGDAVRESESVIVINEAAANRYWPDVDPIGKQIMGNVDVGVPWATVVAVVGDIRQSINEPPRPEVFVPPVQDLNRSYGLLARTDGEPGMFQRQITEAINTFDPDIAVDSESPLTDRLGGVTAAPRFNAVVMSVFAGLALLLATVGVYGVLAYTVVAKRKEIGIRIALGSSRGRVLAKTMGEAARLVGISIVLGVLGVLALGSLIENMLFDVTAADPATIALVCGAVAFATFVAALLPARKASGVDPVTALRGE